jgi:beta-lactamase regulating signal transducer with metallopeptidase domain
LLPVVAWLAKSSLLLVLCAFAIAVLRKGSAATRHALACAGFVGAVALPCVELVAPRVALPLPATLQAAATPPRPAQPEAPSSSLETAVQAHAVSEPALHVPQGIEVAQVCTATWAAIALLLLARLALAHLGAHRLARRARPVDAAWRAAAASLGLTHSVRQSLRARTPLVVGVITPTIIVPGSDGGSARDRELALLHEHAHVIRRDTLTQLLIDVVCAIAWFQPMLWWLRRVARIEAEHAADDHVLRSGARASDYASTLLAAAKAPHGHAPMPALIGDHPLVRRIEAVLDRDRPRTAARWRVTVPAVVAGTLALACAGAPAPVPAFGSASPHGRAAVAQVDARSEASSSRSPNAGDAQKRVDESLAAFVDTEHPRGVRIIVLRPDGSLVARAGKGERGVEETERAVVPGSSFKPLVVAAALHAGIAPEQTFDCAPMLLGAETIRDVGEPSTLDVAGILERSSNVGAVKLGALLAPSVLHQTLVAFGVGQPSGGDAGRLPSPAELEDQATAARVSMGTGVTVSLRTLAQAYATLANEGVRVVDGKPVRVVSKLAASQTLAMLERAVTGDHGTGALGRVEGVRVAGKTGTVAAHDAAGRPAPNRWLGTFVGVLPVDRPQFIIAVGVEVERDKGYWGGSVAAPLFSRIGSALLDRRSRAESR